MNANRLKACLENNGGLSYPCTIARLGGGLPARNTGKGARQAQGGASAQKVTADWSRLDKPPQSRPAPSNAPPAAQPGEGLRVLIVDDDASCRDALELGLGSITGVRSLAMAASGDECLEIIRHKPVDLIILDLVMPGMIGFECCRRVKTLAPAVRIMTATAVVDEASVLECRRLGIGAYLVKPFSLASFQAAVGAALGGQNYVSQEVRFGAPDSAYPMVPSILFPRRLTAAMWNRWAAEERQPGFWFRQAERSQFNVNQLADLLEQSVSKLERDWPFMWGEGVLPKAWLRLAQMEYLRLLVTHSRLSEIICSRVCISEPHHARRAFKKFFVQTIGEYRASLAAAPGAGGAGMPCAARANPA